MDRDRRIGNSIRIIHNMIGVCCDWQRHKAGDDMPPMQGRTLGYLYHNRDRSIYQKDIEQEFLISRATATRMLQSMERKGYILRKEVTHDGRLKEIEMTPLGIAYHNKIMQRLWEIEEQIIVGMTTEEADQLEELLQRIQQNLQKDL